MNYDYRIYAITKKIKKKKTMTHVLPLMCITYAFITLQCTQKGNESNGHHFNKKRNLYSAIYYGDSEVGVGDPFTITCRISASEKIEWLKDGDVIIEQSLRHARDDFSFHETEGNRCGRYINATSHHSLFDNLLVHHMIFIFIIIYYTLSIISVILSIIFCV